MSAAPPGREPSVLPPRERLVRSRAHMRAALLARHEPPPPSSSAWRQASPAGAALWDGLKALPGMGLVADALAQWWAHHPLRSVVVLADGMFEAVVTPLARRNPYTFAAGALVLGALMVWAKPWRMARRHGLLNGLGPALVAAVMARAPLQAWFTNIFAKVMKQVHAMSAEPASAAQAPAAAASAAPGEAAGPAPTASASGGPAATTPFPTSAKHPPQPGEDVGAPLH